MHSDLTMFKRLVVGAVNTIGISAAFRHLQRSRIAILMYHGFSTQRADDHSDFEGLHLEVNRFRNHLRFLRKHYNVVSLEEVVAAFQGEATLPDRAAVITIDDGYRSVYTHAYPILRKYGFPATLFIYTNFAGVGRVACTWDQLKEMKAGGLEIGSHSVSHSDLTKKRKGETTGAYLERVKKELILSKKIIDKKLHQDTRIFAFPYGRYNKAIMTMARKSGYDLAVSVKRGGNPFFSEPLALKRDQILKRDMKAFASRLNTFYKLPLR